MVLPLQETILSRPFEFLESKLGRRTTYRIGSKKIGFSEVRDNSKGIEKAEENNGQF